MHVDHSLIPYQMLVIVTTGLKQIAGPAIAKQLRELLPKSRGKASYCLRGFSPTEKRSSGNYMCSCGFVQSSHWRNFMRPSREIAISLYSL